MPASCTCYTNCCTPGCIVCCECSTDFHEAVSADNGSASSIMQRRPSDDDPARHHRSNLTSRMLAGSLGSVLTSLAVTPLEVVKTRIQAMEPAATSMQVELCPRGCGTWVQHSSPTASAASASDNTFAMVRQIFATEGLSGIYAGLRPTLIMAIPSTVLYYSVYDELIVHLQHLTAKTAGDALWMPMLAGGTARLLASSVTSPLEYLRTLEASANSAAQRNGSVQALHAVVRRHGVRALWRGMGPTLWRDVPFSAIYWLCLERLRALWHTNDILVAPTTQAGQAFINGAAAGMVAAACTTPFDVVKTRRQRATPADQPPINAAFATTRTASSTSRTAPTCHHNGASAVHHVPHAGDVSSTTSTRAMMQHIARTEGVAGLWRGNQARMLKVAPACAIMISSYEFGKRIF